MQVMPDPIPLNLPASARVLGCLMPALADNDDEDVLYIEMPNGLGIDVGNYCNGKPPFHLHIVAFRNYDFHDRIETWDTTDPYEAARIVEQWCRQNV